ncbi:ABC transporter substrate-binding protein [Diaminobutyricimonas sp. LJ205]|uniref:ABC transporter substrate-binding protein n=1 Tax=Diaminobutyricimonas sp. LJ205 TaxID=2683590 RepID=UPI0012F47B8C|nr:ABC transporter substrate-binding protein [Diaminobutyricimonas sp. LJ205]
MPILRSRPARVGILAAVATASLLLAGCATTGASDESTITFGIEGANLSDGHMDIHSTQLDVSSLVLRNTFDSLVAQNPDGSFAPWLAESWEISDDGLQYTFTLREDVTFHDGEPFNAEAVKANFDHVVADETASAQAASLIGYAKEGGYYVDTEVVDEFTVRVNFSQPYAPFLQGVSLPQLGFYSPKVLDEAQDELRAGGPDVTVGTGPFILTEFTPAQELVFEANPDYNWAPEGSEHQGKAASDRLVIRILPEQSTRAGALTSGEVDVIADVTPTMAGQIGDGFETTSVELPGIPYSLYINEANGVFADQKVREAFRIGFDLDAAIENIYGGQFDRAWSVLAPTTPNSYDASLEESWPFDAEKANQLLDEAGWTERDAEGYRVKDGQRLSAQWIAWTPVPDDKAALGDVIQSDLREIGFEIVREALEPAQYNELYGPRTFDITDWGFSSPDADVLRSHLHTGGFQTVSTVTKPELDAKLDAAVSTSDPAEREALYQEIQQWNNEQVLIVPLYVPSEITAANEKVSGLTFDLYGRASFYGATVEG